MNDLRTVINNIISGLYELADALEEQKVVIDDRINFVDNEVWKTKNALRGIVDVINHELS